MIGKMKEVLIELAGDTAKDLSSEKECDYGDAWDLFKVVHPDLAKEAESKLIVHLESLKEKVIMERECSRLAEEGNMRAATLLKAHYRINKLGW